MLSVLTLVRGRSRHLTNLIRGLEQSDILPAELVIVHMNEAAVLHHSDRFPIRSLAVQDPDESLPLAASRNLAAACASSDAFVFLDVDCIPAPELLARYRQALLAHPEALHQGEVRYLPADAEADGGLSEALALQALPHVLHAGYVDGQALPYPLFWSLNFACMRKTFHHIGRFDDRYKGYGAEDTDFAFRARSRSVPLLRSDALAFHQHHASYSPPMNHFDSIIYNARVFKAQWDIWPMEGWLQAFAQHGLISWDGETLSVVRAPSAGEIAACLAPAAEPFLQPAS